MLVDTDGIYDTTALESVKISEKSPKEREADALSETYERAVKLLNHDAIKRQAQQLLDWDLNYVVIQPTIEKISDADGNEYEYPAIGKKPTTAGWPDIALERRDPADIPDGSNLGIQCGTEVERDDKTYYFADVDIDSVGAVPIVREVFRAFGVPKTLSWGRESKRNSHHGFLIDRPLHTTTGDKEFQGILELRCESKGGKYVPYGHQSVIFPSVWTKGDRVELIQQEPDSANEPVTVSADLLLNAVRTAAAVTLFAPLMPDHPRHGTRSAFIRVACEGGLSKEDAVRFLRLVSKFSNNPETDPGKIQSEADELYPKLAAKEGQLFGYPKLIEFVGEKNEDTVKNVLTLLRIDYRPKVVKSAEGGSDSPFVVASKGVYYKRQKKDNEQEEPAPVWVCSPLEVAGTTRDDASESWGKYLTWTDLDDKQHSWAMPVDMLIGNETEVQRTLVYGGLRIGTGRTGRDLLTRYLNETSPSKHYRCVDRLGWSGDCYVLPDRTIGETTEEIIFQSPSNDNPYVSCGTLQQWKDGVAAMAVNNSRLVFALCVGFAAPCLDLVGAEGGGFHFTGATSIGKSTAGIGAASIFGAPKDFMLNWRATSNGMESRAAQHNDSLMVIDEIGQADAKEIGETMYMLSNGKGKERMSRNGSMRKTYNWRTLFLSNGEKSLNEHMQSAGQRTKGGQEVRCLDIPADAGKGLGLFEDLHGILENEPNVKTRSGSFAIEYKRAAEKACGTAGPAFIEKIAGRRLLTASCLMRFIDAFVDANKQPDMSGEVFRALQRFGLIAGAGELATSLGITGWKKGEASKAVATCFKAWLDKRGGVGAADADAGIRQVRLFLEQNPERFQEIIGVGKKLDFVKDLRNIKRAGFKRRVESGDDLDRFEYYLLPEVFKSEVCAGYSAMLVATELAQRGWLEKSSDDRLMVQKRIPDNGKMRVYVVKPDIFE